ncbi:cytochrome P450 2K1-like isoform X1 [Synchiropus splendidus]|uniref:cytochrome P450 2K1-like isoform X1 n=1 Tax=Synchiropus splendidus TaxID=270530 RepID=UPI00237D5948|nr:cytochrome P450 2K1-like isoform X1 [Synchiropus splendidus]
MSALEVLLQSFCSASLLGTLLVLVLVYFISTRSGPQDERREPPGPRALPLLGNLLQLDLSRPDCSLLEFSRHFGSVFTVHFGPKKVVVLAGYQTVKEALVEHAEEFGERDSVQILHEINQGHGVLWTNGDSWREMRRFSLMNLKDFGMGRKVCEDKIIEESHHLMRVFQSHGGLTCGSADVVPLLLTHLLLPGRAFDSTLPMNYSTANIICSMVYGDRFDYEDPHFQAMVSRLNENVLLLGSPSVQVYNLFPWLGKWFANRRRFRQLYDVNIQENLQTFRQLEETLNPHLCRGFVDAFLVRKQSLEDSNVTDSHFHNTNLLMTVLHLFAAGTETTATTLRWGLLLMSKYPAIQQRVHQELSAVVGRRQIQVEDRKNLPYTDAVIHEIQRFANIIPLSLPHRTSRDVTFQGHFIRKGTTVYPLLTSVLYDPSQWETPDSFNPRHFLDNQGRFVKRDAFLPFSAGRRVCLGESLARMELFIFFTSLLQSFRFSPPPGVSEEELDLSPRVGFTRNPRAHQLCAVPRE